MSLTSKTGFRFSTFCQLALSALLSVPVPSLAIELVSAIQNGPTISEHPNGSAYAEAISGDGRYVLYSSSATNITAEIDLERQFDLFIYDRQTETARKLATGANDRISSPRFTNNDHSIVFLSRATNLVDASNDQAPDDTLRSFAYDVATEQIELLYPGSLPTEQDYLLTDDARTLAWNAEDDAGHWHIVLIDRQTGAQRRIGVGSNSPFDLIQFSADGRFLVFNTGATNLHPDATTTVTNVFLADVETGSIRLLTGSLEYYALARDINSDGSLVLIHSSTQNRPPEPFRSSSPLNTAVVNVASGDIEYVENNAPEGRTVELSDDGRFVTWNGKIFHDGRGPFNSLHVKDRLTNTVVHITEGYVQHDNFFGKLSADGSTLVFSSHSNTLVEPDYAAFTQLFAYDTATQEIQKVSKRNNQPLAFSGDLPSYLPSITDDGRQVVFASKSQSLVPGITNVFPSDSATEWGPGNISDHLYLRDRSTASTETITGSSTDEPPDLIFGYSFPNISRDGRYISFSRGRDQDIDLYYDTEQQLLIEELDGLGVSLYDASVQFDASGEFLIYRSSDILDDRNPDGLNGLFLHNTEEDSTRFISFERDSIPITPRHAAIDAAATHLIIHYQVPRPDLSPDDVWRYYNIETDTLEPLFHEDTTQPEPNSNWPPQLLGDTGLVLYQSGSRLVAGTCYLHDRATGNTRPLAPEGPGMCSQPRASNDGSRIVFRTTQAIADSSSEVMSGVTLLDRTLERFVTINSPEPLRKFQTDRRPLAPEISGDGNLVVYVSGRETLAPDGNFEQDLFAIDIADLLNVDNQPPVGITQNVHTPINEALVVFLTARDEDADPLNYEIVRQPQHGTLSGSHPNTLYSPNPDFRGIDRFEFVVTDGIATSAPARVTIEVAETAACSNGCPQLVSAVLPGSRSVTTNATATAFATVINPSTADAFDCGIRLEANPNIDFQFQATDPLTNALVGAPNTLVDIAPGAAQSFVLSLTARANFDAADVHFQFSCANMTTAQVFSGLNTLELSANEAPTPDVIAIALTPTADGIAQVGRESYGVYAVATSNVGAAGVITVRPFANSYFDGDALICQTEPATGACLSPPASSVQSDMAAGSSHSFGVFVRSNASITLEPAAHRHYVHFTDSSNKRRGSTSVALTTP